MQPYHPGVKRICNKQKWASFYKSPLFPKPLELYQSSLFYLYKILSRPLYNAENKKSFLIAFTSNTAASYLPKVYYLAKQTISSPSPISLVLFSVGVGFSSPFFIISHPQSQFFTELNLTVPKATPVAAKTNINKTNFNCFIDNNNAETSICQISHPFFKKTHNNLIINNL